MNFSAIMPQPNIAINRPQKVSAKGNLYKIPITHTSADGKDINTYEIWATKEAVQQHLGSVGNELPKEYELRKFARQMYEKQMRSSNGFMEHKGMLVTTDNITHGNPHLWPHTISHPEVKL